jgi:uncharacterized repeat protein (TIGR03837 family)
MSIMQADIFCQVVDHYGDIGVTWRLAKQLSTEHHIAIRLWVDDLNVFSHIESRINTQADQQLIDQIDIRRWLIDEPVTTPHHIVITSFSCPLSPSWVERMAAQSHQCWVELEYLSAEQWVESHHGLSSQRADGLAPTFFYPGFSAQTAGLIRERDLIHTRDAWQADLKQQKQFLEKIGVYVDAEQRPPFLISLFAYPQAPFQSFFNALNDLSALDATDATDGVTTIKKNQIKRQNTHVLIPEGVTLPEDLITPPHVTWQRIPFLTQPDYDRLLWSMNLNIVRGEDSFVRALWAGKPMIWHIYRQTENTHLTKLAAWLARTTLPKSAQETMMAWSSTDFAQPLETALSTALTSPNWAVWQNKAAEYTKKIALLPDLASNLAHFCQAKTKNTESG